MKNFSLATLLLFASFFIQKTQAGIIIWSDHGEQTGKVVAGVGAGVTIAGAMNYYLGSASTASSVALLLGFVIITLDEEISQNVFKKIIAEKLSFIDDDEILAHFGELAFKQYDHRLSQQEIRLYEGDVRDVLRNNFYTNEEVEKAVAALSK